jgi:glyoxylase-like metal-dependent hydrolase (beta-lactamase superfamily II)/SAM-dependent methyltransferase
MSGRTENATGWFASTLSHNRDRKPKPELIKVTDRVYSAHDFAMSNVHFVVTDRSVVVIDTTESVRAAGMALAEMRKRSPLPVSTIIYTHYHGDHVRGASAFHTPSTRVIAQKLLPLEYEKNSLASGYRDRRTAHQFDFQGVGRRVGTPSPDPQGGYVPPDTLFDEDYRFEEGGVTFELRHSPGETHDHLTVWLPTERVLFPGDLFYRSFPMLSSPMRRDRPVRAWYKSLESMRTLGAEYLIPSHGRPIAGADEIDSTLGHYARAIRHVHDSTLKGINDGLSLGKIRELVRLPDDLARLPYLQEKYGKISWSVNGIFRQYTGWYTFNPKDLNPTPPGVLERAILEACGGAGPLIRQARKALREGQEQLVLELTDIVLGALGEHEVAHGLRAEALHRLAERSTNSVERNLYRAAGETNRQPPQGNDPVSPDTAARSPAPPRARMRKRAAGRPDRARLVSEINRWYDARMFEENASPALVENEFANYGYWLPEPTSLREASEALMEKLLDFIPVKEGTILDVACGKGATTRHLLKYYPPENVTGINISEKQLERCRLNAPGCRFLLMHAESLEFPDGSFDNIICVEAAFHFGTRQDFLREAWRVLKPGGRIVLSDILRSWRMEARNPLGTPFNFVASLDDYRKVYQDAGFGQPHVIDATSECWLLFFAHAARYHSRCLRRGIIDQVTHDRTMDHLFGKLQNIRHYLLVSAQKPDATATAETVSAAEEAGAAPPA